MRTPPARPSIDVDSPDGAPHGDGPAAHVPLTDRDRLLAARDAPDASAGLWFVAAALWSRRWIIIGLTLLAAAGGLWLGLSLPKWYSAETRVLMPEQGGSSMSALIESVAPGASGLLGGGGGGDYTRYLALLTSRTVLDRAVDHFELVQRYETAPNADPRGDARKMLSANTSFEVNIEYNYLAVHVLDKDPQMAASIANYFIGELNRENTRLTVENAKEQREFVETRLREAETELSEAQERLQALQERYGVAEPSVQGQAVFTAIAEASAGVAQAEIYASGLISEFGDTGENAQVNAAKAALAVAREQLARLSNGQSALLPVPLQRLPEVGRQYAQAQQEILLQGEIIKYIRPMYEQAAFDERRVTSAVQVIDEAVPPVRKAKPKVSLVAAGVTTSVFVLLCVWVVGLAALKRSAPAIARRLRESAA